MQANNFSKPARFAYVDETFICLDSEGFSFYVLDILSTASIYYIPIIETKAFIDYSLADQILLENQNVEVEVAQVDAIISSLINKNKLFREATAKLMIHKAFDGSGKNSFSLLLYPRRNLSAIKKGIEIREANVMQNPLHTADEAILFCSKNNVGQLHVGHGVLLVFLGEYCIVSPQGKFVPYYSFNLLHEKLKGLGVKIYRREITEEDLVKASDVLWGNDATLLEWSRAYKHRRFYSKKFKSVIKELV